MGVSGLIARLPDGALSTLAGVVNRIDPLRLWLSRQIINGYAYRTPTRPRPLSMMADYVSWPGLTDRRYSGRHLPRVGANDAPVQPPLDQVVALFKREREELATDTSLLFAFFAQWFTDGFLRTKWEPPGPERRFRENESNHEIDLCQIYGLSATQTAMLRDPDGGGRLRTQILHGETWPAPLFEDDAEGSPVLAEPYRYRPEADEDTPARPGLYSKANFARVFRGWNDEEKRYAFAVGLEHGNSTLGTTLMNTLFIREHNRTADILRQAHPDWSDERLFQTARNVTITVLLNIVIGDYIVHIAPIPIRLEARPGDAENERWYRHNWIAVEFALLYRWHDLIPDRLAIDEGASLDATALLKANRWLVENGLDRALLAVGGQRAGRIGLGNTHKSLLGVKRTSLEMARACGLPSFNAYRRYYGLEPVSSFEALTDDRDRAAALRDLYGDIERLEWFVGLFAEAYGTRDIMGELLTTMVANDAFTQALTNPLLAKAVHNQATFAPEGLAIVRETHSVAQVITRNTGITDQSRVRFTLEPL